MKRLFIFILLVLAMLAPEAYAKEHQTVESLIEQLSQATSDLEKATLNYDIATEFFGEPDEAKPYIAEALKFAEAAGDTETLARAGYVSGLIHEKTKNMAEAFWGFHVGFEAYKDLHEDGYAAECLMGMGRLYLEAYRVEDAAEKFNEARSFLVGSDVEVIANFYADLGDLYMNQGDIETSIQYLKRALEVYEHPLSIAHTELHMGNAYFQGLQYDLAIEAYQRSLRSVAGTPDEARYQSMVNRNLGLIEQQLGNHDLAVGYFESALEYTEDKASNQQAINAMASSYMAMGNHQAASDYLLQSLAMGEDENGYSISFYESHELAMEALENIGELKLAFDIAKDYQNYLVPDIEIEDRVSDAAAVYEVQMAENKILAADLAVANRQILWAVSIASIFGLTILGFVLVRVFQRHKKLRSKFSRKQEAIRELKRMAVSEEW